MTTLSLFATMVDMRDSQRQKVYDAEWAWADSGRQVTINEATNIIKKLSEEFEVPVPSVAYNHQMKRWGGWYLTNSIEFSSGAIMLKTVLHEFAHHLDSKRKWADRQNPDRRDARNWGWRSHGGSFTEAMIDVVWKYFDADTARALIKRYREYGCDIGSDEEYERVKAANEQYAAAEERSRQRDGEEGEVFVVELTHIDNSEISYVSDRQSWRAYMCRNIRWAKTWRTKKAADREAKRWQHSMYQAEVKIVDATYSYMEKSWVASG